MLVFGPSLLQNEHLCSVCACVVCHWIVRIGAYLAAKLTRCRVACPLGEVFAYLKNIGLIYSLISIVCKVKKGGRNLQRFMF